MKISLLALLVAAGGAGQASANDHVISLDLFKTGQPADVYVERVVGQRYSLVIRAADGAVTRYDRALGYKLEGAAGDLDFSLEKKDDSTFVIHVGGDDGMHTSLDRDITVGNDDSKVLVKDISESQGKAWDGTVSITTDYAFAENAVSVDYFDQEVSLDSVKLTKSADGCGLYDKPLTLDGYDKGGLPACMAKLAKTAQAQIDALLAAGNRH